MKRKPGTILILALTAVMVIGSWAIPSFAGTSGQRQDAEPRGGESYEGSSQPPDGSNETEETNSSDQNRTNKSSAGVDIGPSAKDPSPTARELSPPYSTTTSSATTLSSHTTNLGEAGLQGGLAGDSWESVPLTSTLYSSDPLVFATTQTTAGGQDPSQAHVNSTSTGGFDTQHCEVETQDACDSHNAETNGWLALDEASVDTLEGIEAGLVTLEDEDYEIVNFGERFETTPYVFVQAQTHNGNQDPINAQVTRADDNSFTVQLCEQDFTDGCDAGHTQEDVAWIAIDPAQAEKGGIFEWGAVAVKDSTWTSVSFDFPSTPVVLASTQTQNGVQEALYSEVDDVSPTGASVRFCEYDMDDACDAHSWESVAWLAVAQGTLDYADSGARLATESGEISSSGSNDDTGTLTSFSGISGNAPLEVTYKYCYRADTNGDLAEIRTVVDGNVEDTLSFRTPYTGDGSCTFSDPTTYAGYHVSLGTSVSNEIRFNYTNGDWRVAIADITVWGSGRQGDADGDGLSDIEENTRYSTRTQDFDTDDDELTDLEESDQFARPDIFCGSSCELPAILSPDSYLEVDGWEYCDSTGACEIYAMSDSVRNYIEDVYSNQGISLHIDNGQMGGGGQQIQELEETFDGAGAHRWNLGSSLWVVTDNCVRAPSVAYQLSFTQPDSCSYDTGSTVAGDAMFHVDLTSTTSASLSFDHFWETESTSSVAYDIMQVGISTDGGSSWTTLESWDSTDPNPSDWQAENIDLSGYSGNEVDIRFRFDSGDDVNNDHMGWFVDNVVVHFNQTSQNWDVLNSQYEYNFNYFDPGRENVFHHMIWVRYLDNGFCGIAEVDDDFGSVAHEEFDAGGSCDSIIDTTMEEFGHNSFGWIEPHGEESAGGDWCDENSYPDQYRTHDRYDDYAIECGVFHNLDDFHDNRWTEYHQAVATPDGNETGDNNGDLNNGIE